MFSLQEDICLGDANSVFFHKGHLYTADECPLYVANRPHAQHTAGALVQAGPALTRERFQLPNTCRIRVKRRACHMCLCHEIARVVITKLIPGTKTFSCDE